MWARSAGDAVQEVIRVQASERVRGMLIIYSRTVILSEASAGRVRSRRICFSRGLEKQILRLRGLTAASLRMTCSACHPDAVDHIPLLDGQHHVQALGDLAEHGVHSI